MSKQGVRITADLLDKVGGTFGDLLTDSAGDGRGISSWGEARDVDLTALYDYGRAEALDALNYLADMPAKERQESIRKAISAVAVRAFIMGLEVERRRHDAAALPALGHRTDHE